jgi:hypothetical protein
MIYFSIYFNYGHFDPTIRYSIRIFIDKTRKMWKNRNQLTRIFTLTNIKKLKIQKSHELQNHAFENN